ncbi:hypothetical protein F183_A46010 [Bryobacterales bacterium F-183]|nr:hypothetical protein F183_A46010 [Bryobacterales bacterium F-183]
MVLFAVALLLVVDNDPNEIMKRMAENVEASLEARRQYVYKQKVNAKLVRTNGQLARVERREYTVTPKEKNTEKHLDLLAGEYHKSKKEIIPYDKKGFEAKGAMDLDGSIMEDLIDDLIDDKKSRDGIPHSLFPISSKDLAAYRYTYAGSTEVKGRKAHRIAYEPIPRKQRCPDAKDDDDKEDEEFCAWRPWKGEVLVDAEEFQPVRIYSDLTFKMPWAVKAFLGTNIQQTGFSVNYSRVAPNVWFPATYGTEFRVSLLFGYKRVITMSLDSSDFRRTSASSEIQFETGETAKP